MKTKNIYSLPIRKKNIKFAISDSRAHGDELKHATDFIISEGTEVLAALDGIAIHVKDDSKKGGSQKKYSDIKYANFIILKHKNGEYSEYSHLKFRGALVKKGDRVKTKQVIGYSGNTGYTTEPHLHFHVCTNGDPLDIGETLEIRFKEKLNIVRGPYK